MPSAPFSSSSWACCEWAPSGTRSSGGRFSISSTGVRGERWVYACYHEQDPVYEQLFDLETDPDQLVNLAGDPAYREVLEAQRERCAR